MIILDVSALIEVLLQTTKAAAVEKHLVDAGPELGAPHLIDVEVAQALRRLVARRDLTNARATMAPEAQAQFPLRRHSHVTLLPRVWHWRHNLSAYDAVYVSLAEALQTPLVTCDARVGKAAGDMVDVRVV